MAYLSAGGIASACPCCCCLCGTVGALGWQAAAAVCVAEAFAVLSTNLKLKICLLNDRFKCFPRTSSIQTYN